MEGREGEREVIIGFQPATFWHQTKLILGPFEDFGAVEIVLIMTCCASIDTFFRGSCSLTYSLKLALVYLGGTQKVNIRIE